MVAWLFPSLRFFHLIFVLLMLGSWFILGRWFGFGYCPITDWHWKIKAVLGRGDQPKEGYIYQLLQNFSKDKLNLKRVDQCVLIGALVILCVSLIVNVVDWLS